MQRGAALARADPKELVTQRGPAEAAAKQSEDREPTASKAEAPKASEAEALKTAKAEVSEAAEAEAPKTSEAEMLEAGAGLEKELSKAAEASVAVQAVLENEIREHDALQSVARSVCEALEVGGGQSGSSLESCLTMLCDHVHERLREVLHNGVKHALAIVSSHYAGIDLEAISDGYVMAEDDEEKADEELTKLVEAAEAPSATLAKLFEDEVVPPPAPADDTSNPEV
ncbi:uncharacterized protein [Miscanthus floridulus]|uniref:uncharacterized protein n=1 Tax=Miscanthus floridulus TaxID=154761 RepID=UPI0034587D49